MDLRAFRIFDDDARLWVYGFAKPLDEASRKIVAEALDSFTAGWVSHGAPVRGGYDIFENRFLLLAGSSAAGISGCSIDSSVDTLKRLRDIHGIDGLNRNLVFFRNPRGEIRCADRSDFEREVMAGRIGSATKVFDTALQTVGDLRNGRFETTFERCWHARAFQKNVTGEVPGD